MKTTLRELKEVISNYNKLTQNLGTDDLDTEVSILQVLNSNGIQDAVRALKTQKYKDYCLFNADVAESVLHIFEKKHPGDKRPRKCIEGIRLWHAGEISDDELDELKKGATTSYTTHINYTSALDSAAEAARAAASAAYSAAAYSVVSAAISASVIYTSETIMRDKKWKEIEMILRKYMDKNLLDDDLFVI